MAIVLSRFRARRTDVVVFCLVVVLLVGAHATLRSVVTLGLPALALVTPIMFLLFSDRYRGGIEPAHFASFFGAVAVAGALMFLPAISIIAVSALLALGAALLSANYSVGRLVYSCAFTPDRVFPDEKTEMEIRISNLGVLPLGWFSIADPIRVRGGSNRNHLKRLLDITGHVEMVEQMLWAVMSTGAIGPLQTVRRRVAVRALRRGVYALGSAHITTGDAFGLFPRTWTADAVTELIVYPRAVDLDEIAPSFWLSMGSMVSRARRFEDPILLAGSREYHPDDPLRHVHWKATARTGDLHVRVHDPSTASHIMVALNLQTYTHAWQGVDPERMEAVIEVGASLAIKLLTRGFEVGVASNGVVSDVEHPSHIPMSASPSQPAVILEHLARLTYSAAVSGADLLRRQAEKLDRATSILFVTSVLTPAAVEAIQSARLRGRVQVLYCGRFAAPVITGVPIHLVSPVRGLGHAAV